MSTPEVHLIDHPLMTLLSIVILSTFCGAEGWDEMVDWARAKEPWLKTFFGASSPAAHSIAGQMWVWNRVMSLPMKCVSAGQYFLNVASSSPYPMPVMYVNRASNHT